MSLKVLYIISFITLSFSNIAWGNEPAVSLSKTNSSALNFISKAENAYSNGDFESSNAFYLEAADVYLKSGQMVDYVHCLNLVAQNQIDNADYAAAFNFLEKSLDHGNRLGKLHPINAETYNFLGYYYDETAQYNKAKDCYHKAAIIYLKAYGKSHENVAFTYNNLGCHYDIVSDFENALKYYNNARLIYSRIDGYDLEKAAILSNIGLIMVNKGNYELALESYNQALKVTSEIQGKNHPDLATLLNNISWVYHTKRDYAKALEYSYKTLTIFISNYGPLHPDVASSHNNLGWTYFANKDYKNAVDHYKKALSIFNKIFPAVHPDIAVCYNNLGTIYLEQGDFTAALQYFEKARTISLKLGENGQGNLAKHSSNIGSTYLKKGDYKRAYSYFNSSLMEWKLQFGDKHPLVAKTYRHLAELKEIQGDYSTANALVNSAIAANHLDKNIRFSGFNPDQVLSESEMLDALALKASVLLKLYEETGEIKHLYEGFNSVKVSTVLIDRMRSGFRIEDSKYSLAQAAHKIYQEGIEIAHELYKLSGNSFYKMEAFQLSEKSKSMILLESMREADARKVSNIPSQLQEKERSLHVELSFYEKTLVEEKLKGSKASPERLSSLRDNVFKYRALYEKLLSDLEKAYPHYYKNKNNIKTASIRDIQFDLLKENEALLEYVNGTKDVFIFIITREGAEFKKVTKSSAFDSELMVINKFFSSYSGAAFNTSYCNSAFQIYNILIAPVKAQIAGKKLIIIPGNGFGQIPFEALVTKNPASANSYKQVSYLINDHKITYGFSSTLLMDQTFRPKAETLKSCLAFAPKYNNPNVPVSSSTFSTLRDLPGAREELKNISELINGKYFSGKSATEANFKENASEYSVLHLAMHGFADAENPLNSRLVFNSKGSGTEDNILYAYELFSLNINARLAVLSACETGTGKRINGEGVLSMGRVFANLGCPAIVVSLWQASDLSSPILMKSFYSGLSKGLNKSEALHNAKINYLNSADDFSSNPFYWASFISIGDDSPVQLATQDKFSFTSIFITMLILLIMAFAFFYKRNFSLKIVKA